MLAQKTDNVWQTFQQIFEFQQLLIIFFNYHNQKAI